MPSINGVAFTAYRTTGKDNVTPTGPVWPGAVGQILYASVCSQDQGQVQVQIFASLADQEAGNVMETVSVMMPVNTTFDPVAFQAALKSNLVQDAGCVLGYLTLQSIATAEGSLYARLAGATY